MGVELANNELNQIGKQITGDSQVLGNSALAEIYSVANSTADSKQAASNVVRGAINLSQQQENKWLPSVTISAEDLARKLQNEIGFTRMSEELQAEFTELLLSIISDGPAGLNDFDLGLFNGINEHRKSIGLNELEYDPDLHELATHSIEVMAQKGLGHHVGGYENAAYNGGTPEGTIAMWLASHAGHKEAIENPAYTRMGPAGNSSWAAAQFGY